MKNILLQIRYPYTFLVIAVLWLGTAIIGSIRDDLRVEPVLLALSVATIIISLIGFTPGKR